MSPAHTDPILAQLDKAIRLHRQGKTQESLDHYNTLLATAPDHPKVLANLAGLMLDLGDAKAAGQLGELALRLDSTYETARWNLILSLEATGSWNAAIPHLETLLSQNPNHLQAHALLATYLAKQGEPAWAVDHSNAALKLDPAYWGARLHRCAFLIRLGRMDEALADLQILQAKQPHDAQLRQTLAMYQLLTGDWEPGLENLEARWEWHPALREAQKLARAPRWEGQALAGRTLLLCPEQGLGDTINFVRYAPMAKQLGARVVLQAPESLLGVFSTLEGVDDLISIHETPPPHDYYLPLMSAPRLFRTRPDSIPWSGPYLRVPEHVPHREKLQHLVQGEGPKIGIVWAGGHVHERNAERSLDPGRLAALWKLPGLRFFSLQYGQAPLEMPGLTDLAPWIQDFANTAYALSLLDLLVSVDTVTLHLAGAMGIPTLAMMLHSGDWRWMLQREDTPWYPSLRLIRQPTPGDWDAVIQRVAYVLQGGPPSRAHRSNYSVD